MKFTSADVATYFAVRLPKFCQSNTREWRGRCPVHGGSRDSFSVCADTGAWFCHSECGRGGDLLALEMALSGAAFAEAKNAVLWLVGRSDERPGYCPPISPQSAPPRTPVCKRPAAAEWLRQTLVKDGWRVVEVFAYGERLRKVRLEHTSEQSEKGKPSKTLRWEHFDGSGWMVGKGGLTIPCLFTNTTFASPDIDQVSRVVGVEGEAKALALDTHQIPAFCFREADRPELYRALVDLRVTLWPDADEPGLRLAAKRAQLILPHARSVHIARLNTMSAAVGGAR